MKKVIRKIKSGKAFSLSELLMALLVLGLLTVGVANGVTAALNVYRDSVNYSEARTLLSTLSEAVSSELRYARDINETTGAFTSDDFGVGVKFGATEDGKVTLDSGSNTRLLMGDGAYSSGRLEGKVECAYESGQYNVTITVKIKSGSETPQVKELTVRPIINQ